MAALSKKRSCDSLREETGEVCVICNLKGNSFPKATERGLQKLAEAANARESVGNGQYKEAIQRITDATDFNGHIPNSCGLQWHRNCYTEFTHKGKIERLKEKQQNANSKRRKSSQPGAGLIASSSAGTGQTGRRIVPPVDWNLCIFCQQSKPREALIAVTTFNVSTSIL